jgi:hypothetical protein
MTTALLYEIPPDIVRAALQIEAWFAKEGVREWKLGGVQSRSSDAAVYNAIAENYHKSVALNSDRTVGIDRNYKWLPIDENTPRGIKLQLISKRYGVAHYGQHHAGNTFFTHYQLLPTFDKDEK